jgi:serine/threonine-protein kinase
MKALDANRNLLFGLLALQTGLIDQDQLVAAFRAWSRGATRSMAEHLVARGELDGEQRALVEAMVAMHLKKHGGDARQSLAAIPAGRSTRESLAAIGDPEIEQTLTHLGSGSDGDADRTASYMVGTATSDGPRFRVLRPHARGGLGAVFVALDAELNREVALKQIHDQHADDPTSRARFLLEAEVTGGLEHPGIVPAYGMGTYADGRPFYAMRFIKGDSLKEAADRFHADESLRKDPGRHSLELRMLLRRFTDVCNAIDYAHSRGVLHRDIKPGNVIVGRHGETLVVDWGLAKAVGRVDPRVDAGERALVPSSGGSAETLPGSALGTPAYMSPERATGELERLGIRSDVYGLGATLYYILTGRPPFEGGLHDVIRAMQRGDVTAPRRHDASIDRALEAVCLKAMAHRPDDRHGSAKALSEDVERWMAEEPVSAWREPLMRRARRWATRNRTAVIGATAALVAWVVGLSAVLVVQTRAKAAITRALGRETDAYRALADAYDELAGSKAAVQSRYDLAVEAIKTFHTGASEDFLLKEDRFKPLRDRLLKSAADFYGRLAGLLGREMDLAARRALATTNYELAELTGKVGRREDALAAHRSVLAAREALAADPEAGVGATVDIGRSLIAVAGLLQETGQADPALAGYRRAEALLAGPAASDLGARAALAACRTELGWLLHTTGKFEDAIAALRRARADQESVVASPGATALARRELADTISRIGTVYYPSSKPAEAQAEHGEALLILQKLADEEPASTDLRARVATLHGNLGMDRQKAGRFEEAEADYRRALAIYRELAEENPGVTRFRYNLAWAHELLAFLGDQWGNKSLVETEVREAAPRLQSLSDEFPAVTRYLRELHVCRQGLEFVLLSTGRLAEAEAEGRAALDLGTTLAAGSPATHQFQLDAAVDHHHLGEVLAASGDPQAAEAEYRQALGLLQAVTAAHPAIGEYRARLAQAHHNLGALLRNTSRIPEAEAECRQALRIARELAADQPDVADFREMVARVHRGLGDLLMAARRPTEAEAEYRQALAGHRAVVRESPGDAFTREELAKDHAALGLLFPRAGRPEEAEAEYRRALAVRQELAEVRPKVADHRDDLASAHTDLGDLARSRGRAADALGAYARAVALRERLVREEPRFPSYRSHLAASLRRRGLARADGGDPAGAMADTRRALELYDGLPSRTPAETFEAACSRAALAGSPGSGPVESDRAMDLLRSAVPIGYRDPEVYRTEAALDPLRDRKDFRLLMMDLTMPAEVFAQ